MQILQAGEQFERRYVIRELLGRGGFAEVYRAYDQDVARDVAIKILIPEATGYPKEVERRFQREARVVAGLQDPHTITMFDYGRSEQGLLFMVFEFVHGDDLSKRLATCGRFEPEVVEHILRQILSALVEAHDHGVLHRDLKPANVILYRYGDDPHRVKLIDFGIAKPLADATGEATHLTREGIVVGTPRYMAPEQFFGEQLTPSADLYSLGLIAHEMLLGRPAIDSKTPRAIIMQHIEIDSIRLPPGAAPAGLAAVVDRMTERRVSDRFQRAGAVLAAMTPTPLSIPGTTVARAPEQPTSTAAPDTVSEPVRTPTAAWSAVAVLFLLALVGAFGVLWTNFSAPSTESSTKLPSALIKTTPVAEVHQPAEPVAVARPQADAAIDAGDDDAGVGDGCGREVPDASLRSSATRNDLFARREWVTYTPRGYDPTSRLPIVMMFHRTSRGARSFFASTSIADVADRHGFVVLSFEAQNNSEPWKSANDLMLVKEALVATAASRCVDPSRLYALGDGAGGRFARELGCHIPLSAVATTASGQHYSEHVCRSEPPTPFIRLYGSKDRDVPPEGGPGCLGGTPFMPATEIADQWRERNGCRGGRRSWLKHRNGRCSTWKCAAAVVSCEMDGGHDWPTAPAPLFKLPRCAAEPPDFPMAETIWRFFDEHGRDL